MPSSFFLPKRHGWGKSCGSMNVSAECRNCYEDRTGIYSLPKGIRDVGYAAPPQHVGPETINLSQIAVASSMY